ncbi:MAG: 4Fe-4S dicluster domain-containing protein [Melioribacteraceae bacterium]|nr:4Fe-4S dicluster domain-containing protein [Melioribacteraceae bacterium]MCF8263682.1 4Fe-4S dicluster domain-containing protein [Melioribacteraceae bacterium]MCF8414379.1 4Fe-4S dicluster domain-containing protein [Melioribacteraceae bacterium]MCF8431071.1 4Fe-4S dicluster domain-containing protein [Melioribacteraceae bacterium]
MIKQKGILFDATMCVGCGECYYACKAQNENGEGKEDFLTDHLSYKSYTVVEEYEDEIYTRKMCMHCVDPTCVSVCPVGAFTKTEFGPVLYDGDKCMGCRYCMQACPHNIPRYEWQSNNPVVQKCTMCHDRIKNGEMTACAEACPAEATLFGDLEELKEIALQRIADDPDTYYPHVYGLEEAGGTHVLILSPVPFEQLGFAGNLPNEPLPELTKRALDKIPHVVSVGSVFLGGMYWLTKRKNQIAEENRMKEDENA